MITFTFALLHIWLALVAALAALGCFMSGNDADRAGRGWVVFAWWTGGLTLLAAALWNIVWAAVQVLA